MSEKEKVICLTSCVQRAWTYFNTLYQWVKHIQDLFCWVVASTPAVVQFWNEKLFQQSHKLHVISYLFNSPLYSLQFNFFLWYPVYECRAAALKLRDLIFCLFIMVTFPLTTKYHHLTRGLHRNTLRCSCVTFIYLNGDSFSICYQILEKPVGAWWHFQRELNWSRPNM